MILDTFRQDVRIGLRILFKEKTFCLLAVLVLALGIAGVTTQFTIVNAFVLRGFSFAHPEQLASVGLIDPQGTPQQNNFGNGNIPAAQDYEDLKAGQQSFAMMAGYLNGSTINVSYKNNPQRYTGGYVTEDFFRIVGVSPIMGRDFTAADNKPGAEKTTILGYEIWKRDFGGDPNIVGQSVRINGKAATIIGVMPQNFKFPISEELWVPLYNEFPLKPREDPLARGSAPAVMGRLKEGVSLDQVNAEFAALATRLAKDNPKTNEQLTSASVQPLLNSFTGPATAPDHLRHARRGASRVGDRVRERDEHAVRSRRVARQGTGDPRGPRSHPLAPGPADDDGKLPPRRHGSDRRRVVRALERRLARPGDERPAVPVALLGPVHH